MSEEKKIFIDEDWKSQIAAEKEELQREAEEQTESPQPQPQPGEVPPASLEMLVTMFASEAMMALGQLPNPATGELSISLDHARYAIDMLQMLQEKTKGNLDPNEAKMLEDLLHQLRMLFVASQSPPLEDAPSIQPEG